MAVLVRPESSTAIRVRGLSKSFGATQALAAVSLDVKAGSIHALVGLNGSGKSTLVKVLSGFYKADEGEATMGEVAFVHQDLGLLPSMTVLENFAIGRVMPTRHWQLDWRAAARRATEALREFDLQHLIGRPVSTLTQAEQTVVAIARALSRSSTDQISALVLDEPTSTLPNREIGLLATAMRSCAARGIAILFITHRLQEVLDICDEITVLRNGHVVFTGCTSGLTVSGIVKEMVGDATTRVLEDHVPTDPGGSPPVLAARSVRTSTIKNATIEAYGGEIVGIFGMGGSGVESIGGVLAGRVAALGGTVSFGGLPLIPQGKRTKEIGYVPSDRPHKGILPGLSIRENISLRSLPATLRAWMISHRAERALVLESIQNLKITPANPAASILTLSGGNQQKAVLGRWLAIKPRAIVAEEPTQGIDVWAKMEILQEFRLAAKSGTAVVLTAVEPEEILEFCDRVLVFRRGSLALNARRADVSVTDILNAMH
jgi:ABC-type sugar transport system ATPase subunit